MTFPASIAAALALAVGFGLVTLVPAILGARLNDPAPPGAGRWRRAGMVPWVRLARTLGQRRAPTLAADRLLGRTAVVALPVVALLMVALLPLGGFRLADSAVGLVWFNALDVMVWALFWLIGWGPNSVYPLIGGYRFLAQAMSYELPLMFAITTPAVAAHSLRFADIVAAQQGLWFVVWMPVAFVVFCLGVVGFSLLPPLNHPGGVDIAGGVGAELTGLARVLVGAGRYLLLTAGSATAATMFLGGGAGPVLPAGVWLVVKTVVVACTLVTLRTLVPTIRADRFVEVGWLVLIPATLLQLLLVSVLVGMGVLP